MSPKLADTPRSRRTIGFDYWKRNNDDGRADENDETGPIPKKLRMETTENEFIDLKDLTVGTT